VQGLLNVQFALAADVLYVLEANPRASRTVAVRQQGHRGVTGQGSGPDRARRNHRGLRAEGCCRRTVDGTHCRPDAPVSVKEAVLPFKRFVTDRAWWSTASLGRRCARPVRSWASTTTSGPRLPKSQAAAYGGLR